MTIIFRATYTGGVLRPVQPLALAEGQTVEVTVDTQAAQPTDDEVISRIQACTTYEEWLAVTKTLPTDDDGYDIIKALDENRRWSGDGPLIPAEGGMP